jgi:hypothetical protein
LITIPEGKQPVLESADDAMCQRMQWIALQMAQQDTEWLKGEFQRFEQKIKAKQQELLESSYARHARPLKTLRPYIPSCSAGFQRR